MRKENFREDPFPNVSSMSLSPMLEEERGLE